MMRTPSISREASSASHAGAHRGPVRSLPLEDWPLADRMAWVAACRPAERLKRGGLASHLKQVTRDDLVRHYGYFLGQVRMTEEVDVDADAAFYVTNDRVQRFLTERRARVSSVTVYTSISKLRRMAQLLAPQRDFSWLSDLENDLALVMQPRSKFGRFVHSEVLAEAGLTLMVGADASMDGSALARARQFRDGLMIALLALCPVRLKNFAALEINRTFRRVSGAWWIVLPAAETKERRSDERPVPDFLTPWIDRYLGVHRPILCRTDDPPASLWPSSRDGRPLTSAGIQQVIGATTLATVGIELGPHMFRTAAASTSAIHGGRTPHLASALLHHTNPAVTQEHYNRASSLSAAQTYAALVKTLRRGD